MTLTPEQIARQEIDRKLEKAGKLKISEEQMNWLRMIKNHISTLVHFSREDLDYAPFDA